MIKTRFAPSPTGFLHIGGVRTGLFSYLYSKKNNGKFIIRIEDTDKERSREEWVHSLIDDLHWLGLENDVLARTSDSYPTHAKYIQKMIDDGFAYISKETPKEEGQRDEVIRFKNPNKKVVFNDMIRGDVEVDTTDLGDFIIARSVNEPLYHSAVVIDDYEMGITHVIRAEEHLSNTPRQILLQEAIGAPRPIYAHLPLVLASDKSKLSKRKHGETVSLTYYRNRGYLKEAIINYVAMLGWNPGTDREFFTIDELIKEFSLEKIQKGGAVFDVEKLNWFNKHYMEKLDRAIMIEEIEKRMIGTDIPKEMLDRLIPSLIERISVFSDIDEMREKGELFMYTSGSEYEKESLIWKTSTQEETLDNLKKVLEIFESKDDFSSKEIIKDYIWNYAEEKGRGNVLWPLRYALSGKDKSPDPFDLTYILGKNISIERIKYAIKKLSS